MVNHSYLIF